MSRSLLYALMFLAAACVTNPIKTANTVQQKAYATYGTFVVFEELAAKLVQNAAIPEPVKADIAKADRIAKPTMDTLLAAVQGVDVIQTQLVAGQVTPDKLAAAVMQLSAILNQATPQVEQLVKIVQGAKNGH